MKNMKTKMINFLKRLKQPSSMAGLAALALLFGVAPGTIELVSQVVAGGAALAAIVINDGSGQ